jgi:hypothetical protein
MKYIITLLLFSNISCTLTKRNSKVTDVKLEALTDSVADIYASSILKEDLNEHLSILASDEYEGRETAKPGQKKAAKYISDQFRKFGVNEGVSGSYLQTFEVDVKNASNVFIGVNNNNWQLGKDFYYVGNLKDTELSNIGLIDAGYGVEEGEYSDYSNINVKGKFIIVRNGAPPTTVFENDWYSWRRKVKLAEEKGAVGIITIKGKDDFKYGAETTEGFIQNPSMQMHNPGRRKADLMPNIYISDSTSKELLLAIDSVLITIKVDIEETLTSDNVLGYIEGTDLKEELVVITAHYDHLGYDNGEVCNGADDDGSGTVSVIELAEAFQKAKDDGNGPRRSILFMTVSGEEKGLWGSKYYAENPVYNIENTVVDLNIDMIGRRDDEHDYDNYIYLIGADRISMDLHLISEKVNKKYINYDLDYTYNDRTDPNQFYYRSDHYNFAKKGIPVIFYFSGVHKDYHKPTDDVDKINFDKVQKTARMVFYTAWEIANRDQRLRMNGID